MLPATPHPPCSHPLQPMHNILPPLHVPTPVFGQVPHNNDENDLPDASYDAILASCKCKLAPGATGSLAPKQTQVPESILTAWSKARGCETSSGAPVTKLKLKRAAAKKKKGEESESDEEWAPKKGGQACGVGNWSPEDFTGLLDAVESILPAGKQEWEKVYARFTAWEEEHGRLLCSCDMAEKRFKAVSLGLHCCTDL